MGHEIVAAREVFRHFSELLIVVFYLFATTSLGVFAFGLWLRIEKYRAGRPGIWTFSWRQLVKTVSIITGHTRLRKRNPLAGWAHMLIFWGFVTLLMGTLTIFVDHDILRPLNPALQFWRGGFYLGYSLLLDLMGFALLVGLVLMAIRRSVMALPNFDYARRDRSAQEYSRLNYIRDDNIFLWGLVAILATGFVLEALRIAADRPLFEVWSIVGWQLANCVQLLGLSSAAADKLYPYVWFSHALLALAFIAYIPYSKAVHILLSIASLLLQDPRAGKELTAIPEDAESMGYRRTSDLTRKELIALDACTKCGRCQVACPAFAGGWPLSPRDIVLELREQAEQSLGGWTLLCEVRPNADNRANPASMIKPEVLWSCTTCLACVETCPVAVEHVPLIVQMRRNLVENGTMEANLQRVLENIGKSGNSFGVSERSRGQWTKELPFTVKDARKEKVDYLWFVGDYASFDPALQEISRRFARVMHAAGVDFGILYDGERNSGNDVRRVGEEGLYQMLVESNIAALHKAQFNEIITTDPHSYNTIKSEYSKFGGDFRIRHYVEVLAELIDKQAVRLKRQLGGIATYHDPCHLARYNDVIDAPRAILRKIGVELVEMRRHGPNSFCCGAGGGRIWMTSAGAAERPAVQRIKEAAEIPGLKYFVVACPKDVTMFRDAVKTAGYDQTIEMKEIIELVAMAMDIG